MPVPTPVARPAVDPVSVHPTTALTALRETGQYIRAGVTIRIRAGRADSLAYDAALTQTFSGSQARPTTYTQPSLFPLSGCATSQSAPTPAKSMTATAHDTAEGDQMTATRVQFSMGDAEVVIRAADNPTSRDFARSCR